MFFIIYLEIFRNSSKCCFQSTVNNTLNNLVEVSVAFQDTFKALSDPVRRDILDLLKNGKLSAGEIGQKFEMTGATISYHLSILKKAELVRESKFKNFVYYEINTSVFEEIMLWFTQFKNSKLESEEVSDEEKN